MEPILTANRHLGAFPSCVPKRFLVKLRSSFNHSCKELEAAFNMYHVSRQIDFCYGHRLLQYDGKCKHLHGHNGRAVISIAADKLDDLGMVMDFSDIKKVVSTWIDDELDHRMILHKDDPVVPMLKELGEPMYLIDENPTAENIAKLIFDFSTKQGYPVTRVDLWETRRCYASFTAD